MLRYPDIKSLIKKAISPITIMVIPQSNTGRAINVNISLVSAALFILFSLIGAIYLSILIPDAIRYQSSKHQLLAYSQKISEFNDTFLSVQQTEKKLYTLLSMDSNAIPIDKAAMPMDGEFSIHHFRQRVEYAVDRVDAVKDYLRTQKKKMTQEKRILFSVKLTDVDKYDQIIFKASRKYNVDAALIKAIIKTESNFDHQAVSPRGAQGLMQLMPQTAQALRVEDSFHPKNNIEAGTRYLRYLLDLFDDNIPLALAAYNAGENAVIRNDNNIPPYKETHAYIQRVLDHLNAYRQTTGNQAGETHRLSFKMPTISPGIGIGAGS